MKTPIPFASNQRGYALGSMAFFICSKKALAAGPLSLFMDNSNKKFDFSMGIPFDDGCGDLHRKSAGVSTIFQGT